MLARIPGPKRLLCAIGLACIIGAFLGAGGLSFNTTCPGMAQEVRINVENEKTFAEQKVEVVNQLAQEVVNHLEQKYQRSFVIASLTEGNFLTSDQKIRVYAEGDNPDTSMAEVYVTGYGETMTDNYFGIQVRAEYEAAVYQCLSPVYQEMKVFSAGFLETGFPEELDHSKTYREALAMGVQMSGILYIYTQDPEQKVESSREAATDALQTAGISGLVKVIGLRAPHLEDINQENFNNLVPFFKDTEKERCTVILDFFVDSQENADHDAADPQPEQEGN